MQTAVEYKLLDWYTTFIYKREHLFIESRNSWCERDAVTLSLSLSLSPHTHTHTHTHTYNTHTAPTFDLLVGNGNHLTQVHFEGTVSETVRSSSNGSVVGVDFHAA